jgi:hypothetical protein
MYLAGPIAECPGTPSLQHHQASHTTQQHISNHAQQILREKERLKKIKERIPLAN